MWDPKVVGIILKVAEKSRGGPSTSMRGPVVAVLDEWGPPREFTELSQTPQGSCGDIGRRYRGKTVAAARAWQLLFILRKAEAELTAEAKVNLNVDSCSSESEPCECE